MIKTVKWLFLVSAIAAPVLVADSAPPTSCSGSLEPYCGNWSLTSVSISNPAEHMSEGNTFAIRRARDNVWLLPRGNLKALWGEKRRLYPLPSSGAIECLVTLVEPHKKVTNPGKAQSHVIRFAEVPMTKDTATGENYRGLCVSMINGDALPTKSADCGECTLDLHDGYSHAED